jgi:hypothetical protein
MPLHRVPLPGTNKYIEIEILTALCKVFNDGEPKHYMSFIMQSGLIGESVIKNLEGPEMDLRERKVVNEGIDYLLAEVFRHHARSHQRKKAGRFITVFKKLFRKG